MEVNMRVSQLFLRTLREPPADAETISHRLLVRGGFVRQLTAGVYSYLPLGQRVLLKIAQVIREEMNAAGGQEITMPVLQPLELWEVPPATGGISRAEDLGQVLFRLKDRRERDLVLGPTHEEVVTLLAKEMAGSYRNLPQRLYQIQTKFRDEARPRAGIIRLRQFTMKDLYSFDADEAGMDASYEAMIAAYKRIFGRCGLNVLMVEADSGAIGGKDSQEFLALSEAGEDDAIFCPGCGYAANREKAEFARSALPEEAQTVLEEVYTPGQKTIADLSAFLNMPAAKMLKSVCYSADGRLIFALVRGDLEVNEVKLYNAVSRAGLNASTLHLAMPEEMASGGTVVAGYTSPIGLDERVLVIADISVQMGRNFVAGANREDYHVLNANLGRDFRVDVWADLASAYAGATCARCGGVLSVQRGAELGHAFKLGTRYTQPFDATFLGEDGQERLMLMGCYGIGLDRIMALTVEQHYDERGICWPLELAPFQVVICALGAGDAAVEGAAERLYATLSKAGVEALYDDRAESAGVKFNDADLIGIPLRLVVSKRALARGGVEWKLRSEQQARLVALEEVVSEVQSFIG
jgi:prolyl-tRNA synthetase